MRPTRILWVQLKSAPLKVLHCVSLAISRAFLLHRLRYGETMHEQPAVLIPVLLEYTG